ncbi:crtp3, partial [Symbiodinium sp. KB8]
FVYIPTSFLYIALVWKYGTSITPEAAAVPKYKFAIMGCLDSLSGIMQVLSIALINNGSLVTLLMQSAIPFSMIISRLVLGTRYTAAQYSGAAVVVMGLVIVLLPSFIHPAEGGGKNTIVWCIVLMLSCVPMALSSVYKEMNLDDVDIDVVYLNGWVAIFQLVAAVPLLYPSGIASGVKPADIWENVYHGLLCYGGINSVHETIDGIPPDDCKSAAFYLSVYLVFNLAYNILIIYLLKFGGSNILWLSITFTVPLVNVAFALPFMPNHKTLTWENWVGLVLIMGGLIVYRFWDKLAKSYCPAWACAKPKEEKKTTDLGRGESPGGVSLSGNIGQPLLDDDGLVALGDAQPSPGTPGGVATPGRGSLLHVQRTRRGGPKGSVNTSEAPY